jgi:hypothetical protein
MEPSRPTTFVAVHTVDGGGAGEREMHEPISDDLYLYVHLSAVSMDVCLRKWICLSGYGQMEPMRCCFIYGTALHVQQLHVYPMTHAKAS